MGPPCFTMGLGGWGEGWAGHRTGHCKDLPSSISTRDPSPCPGSALLQLDMGFWGSEKGALLLTTCLRLSVWPPSPAVLPHICGTGLDGPVSPVPLSPQDPAPQGSCVLLLPASPAWKDALGWHRPLMNMCYVNDRCAGIGPEDPGVRLTPPGDLDKNGLASSSLKTSVMAEPTLCTGKECAPVLWTS